jgi:hypothetical protein
MRRVRDTVTKSHVSYVVICGVSSVGEYASASYGSLAQILVGQEICNAD